MIRADRRHVGDTRKAAICLGGYLGYEWGLGLGNEVQRVKIGTCVCIKLNEDFLKRLIAFFIIDELIAKLM